jgi:transcriptional antiterminator RfaH
MISMANAQSRSHDEPRETEGNSHWYVLRTNPGQEDRAASNLQAWGVEALNPKIRQGCYDKRNGRVNHVVKCLFSRYIFARFRASSMLHKIRFTRGVQSVVSFGGLPTPVDEDVINIIRHRTGQDGLVRMGDELKLGDTVTIKHGPFRNLIGIFEREVGDPDRVQILLTAISYQARVVIERGLIERVGQTEPRSISPALLTAPIIAE